MSIDGFNAVSFAVAGEQDLVRARAQARAAAQQLGFRLVDQSRVATAVSELTRNVLRYATNGRGDVAIRALHDVNGRVGIEIVVSDNGPGIQNVATVMQEGYSTGHGLGLGLSGTRRLMDDMDIESSTAGTVITIRKWNR